ncbi:MAG: hypothetical protein RL684_328, partial [Pseudomonadota bacterium]
MHSQCVRGRGCAPVVQHGASTTALVAVLAFCATPVLAAGFPFQDPALATEQRVSDLVARLTTDEKIHQLNNDSAGVPRLGLAPYNVWNEALHGVARNGHATVFPQAIGLAATFDTDRLHEVGRVIAAEARAKHGQLPAGGGSGLYEGLTFFSPNINIFRDPRWGRGQETYGEDPYLTGRMGVAFIRGLQGDDPAHPTAGATAKHYAVHSGPELLRHGFDVHPSAHDREDTYLPAFRAAVVDGQVASVMCVYNAIDGVPGCANEALLSKRLRGDWGFNGFVVSDCNAVSDMYSGHHYFKDEAAAAAGALLAGVDNECTVRPGAHEQDYDKYAEALRAGLITQADIDRAVARVLRERIALGLLDPPGAQAAVGGSDTPANRAMALQVARESLVLLKNDGLLPMRAAPRRIAVVGPLAVSQRALEGNYNGTPSRVTDVLAGIRNQFPGAQVSFEPGTSDFLRSEVPVPTAVLSTDAGEPGLKLEFLAAPGVEARAPRTVPGVLIDNRSDAGIRTARWTGWLVPDATGDYRLAAHGSSNRVWLDDQLVVDTISTGTESRPGFGDVHLEQGHRYALRVENQPSLVRGVELAWFRKEPEALARAVSAARAADVVIAVVGITADLEGEESALDIPGFKGGDRTSLDLPAPEQQLLEAVRAEGKPLAVVLMSGSGLAVNWAQAHANAILQAWYPGEEGGQAVGEALSGAYNP